MNVPLTLTSLIYIPFVIYRLFIDKKIVVSAAYVHKKWLWPLRGKTRPTFTKKQWIEKYVLHFEEYVLFSALQM